MQDEKLYDAFSKIQPDDALKKRIEDRIEVREMKKASIKHTGRIILVAAIVMAMATTVFAMSPAGQETINSIIAYFQNDKATEISSLEDLEKYNEEIGASVTKDGYTLTLDNVAADDNFIHVFYTITSDNTPFYAVEGAWGDLGFPQMDISVVINGQLAGCATNHNSHDGYFVDEHTYKVVEKYNIATLDIPDNFKVELFGDVIIKGYTPEDEPRVSAKLYRQGYESITDEDRASVWYVCADIDKSSVKVETVTREINAELPWLDAKVEKAVLSPFGNQLVIMTEPSGNPDVVARVDSFALFDENGTALDLLNTDLQGSIDGSSRNSIEFLKADRDTKQLKFVPLKFNEHGDADTPKQKIGTYPLKYKVSDYGSVVVTDVRITDGEIAIDYYKDGFVMYDPGFVLMDNNGNNAEPGGKLGCVLYTDTHYNTNSYTARYVYDAYDENGQKIPPDEGVSAQSLRNSFTTLGVCEQKYVRLDFDKAVTVDLK